MLRVLPLILFLLVFTPVKSQQKISDMMDAVYKTLELSVDSAVQLMQENQAYIETQNWQTQNEFYAASCDFYRTVGDFNSEIASWKKSIKLNANNNDSIHLFYIPLALAEQNMGLPDSSLYHLEKAADYFLLKGEYQKLARAYGGLGNHFSRFDEQEKAFKYQYKSIEIDEYYGNNEQLSRSYINLSIHYQFSGDLLNCLETRKKGYHKALLSKNEDLIHFAEYNLGTTYTSIGNPDSGLFLLNRSVVYYEQNFDKQMLNALYNGLAHTHSVLGNLDTAEMYMEKSIQILQSGGSEVSLINSLTNLGFLLKDKGDFKKGVQVCQDAYAIAARLSYAGMEVFCAECLYKNFKAIQLNDSALYYHEIMMALQDSLDNTFAQKTALAEELAIAHSKETQQITNEAKEEIKVQEVWSRTLIIACILLGLAILTLFYALWQRKKASQQIIKEKEYLDNLLHNLVHEFRTPLTLINGPVSDLLKNDQENVLLKIVNRNSIKMLELVNQVLDFAKIKAGRLEVKNEITNIEIFLHDTIEGFRPMAESKSIQLDVVLESQLKIIKIDSDKLFKIVSNLISNAIKYTDKGGRITVAVEIGKNVLKVNVSDNGVGLSDDDRKKVFDKFYQVDATSTRKGEGTGLGLAFVKELIDLMQGQIWVNSTLKKGSTFSIAIPFESIHEEKLKLFDQSKKNQTNPFAEIDQNLEKDIPQILIIEDNKDLRDYLKLLLQNDYICHEAENGQEGIDLAIELIPDLIISDVMMPIKDGYQVVSELKNDPRTDHIPITILTAKASFDSRIKGLEIGADDYLSKPFSSDELIMRVANQIKYQEKLRSKYNESGAKSINSVEEHPFVTKLREKILERTELNFTADELASEAALSRSQLHRKLKSLTGLSATAFVNHVKLNAAFEDLSKTHFTVSEIAYKYGYSDPAYFGKLFKTMFGKSPSDLQ